MLLTIYKEEDGSISAVKLATESPEEAQDLLEFAERYKPEQPGSGSERWEHHGWTQAGDGLGYPGGLFGQSSGVVAPTGVVGLPTQAQADAAALPDAPVIVPAPPAVIADDPNSPAQPAPPEAIAEHKE